MTPMFGESWIEGVFPFASDWLLFKGNESLIENYCSGPTGPITKRVYLISVPNDGVRQENIIMYR